MSTARTPAPSENSSTKSSGWGLILVSKSLPFVGADELAFVEDVPFHGFEELTLGQAGGHIELGIEGVDLEVVVVDAVAFGGHGATVAPIAEIVLSFECSLRVALRKLAPIRGYLVHHPVDEGLGGGRVGVVADERDLPGSFGQVDHLRGGDTFWPSPVYFCGMEPPTSKAELDT